MAGGVQPHPCGTAVAGDGVAKALLFAFKISAALSSRDEVFDVALRPGNRAFREAENRPGRTGRKPGAEPFANHRTHRRITNDATLSHLIPSGLELRLNEGDKPSLRSRQLQRCRQSRLQAD